MPLCKECKNCPILIAYIHYSGPLPISDNEISLANKKAGADILFNCIKDAFSEMEKRDLKRGGSL